MTSRACRDAAIPEGLCHLLIWGRIAGYNAGVKIHDYGPLRNRRAGVPSWPGKREENSCFGVAWGISRHISGKCCRHSAPMLVPIGSGFDIPQSPDGVGAGSIRIWRVGEKKRNGRAASLPAENCLGSGKIRDAVPSTYSFFRYSRLGGAFGLPIGARSTPRILDPGTVSNPYLGFSL